MIPAPFEYYSPRSINEAVDFLSAHKDDEKFSPAVRACCRS